MKDNIKKIYVVGFPKSGNTWLVRLLADSLGGLIGGADKNEEIEKFNKRMRERNPNPEFCIIKSHALPEDFFSEKKESIHGIVYTQRDFRDVIVSAFFHHHRRLDQGLVEKKALQEIISLGFVDACRHFVYRLLFWKELIYLVQRGWGGSMRWPEHIDRWQAIEEKFPQIYMSFTSYESLKANTPNSLGEILKDLNLEVASGIIDEAVRRQSFENKKAYFQQKYEETGDPKYQRLYTFMRKGRSGDWKNYFIL